MTSFWPEGIDIKDTRKPHEICAAARDEWYEKGGLNLRFKFGEKPEELIYLLEDAAIYSTWSELEYQHYPVAIQSFNDDFFRCCYTPKEFEQALIELLNSRIVKLLVTNALVDRKVVEKEAKK
jgi:hypothetical protein